MADREHTEQALDLDALRNMLHESLRSSLAQEVPDWKLDGAAQHAALTVYRQTALLLAEVDRLHRQITELADELDKEAEEAAATPYRAMKAVAKEDAARRVRALKEGQTQEVAQ